MYCKATVNISVLPAEGLIMGQNRVQDKVYAAEDSTVVCDLGQILKPSIFHISYPPNGDKLVHTT